ncbi:MULTISPECIES: N-acetylmuramoyl-L-alanine amidase [unclassified Yoonia]|uniref:N-acetylmuramoyl-L-alanine amidase n=1 Tax=unclassified Yoonia TaxID=2629118 RepID=UPI002AFE48F8|nr:MULTISPECIES: N-acetylmuramoyl-L-alanine amidase [unclassified Yoonia]
MRFANHKAKGIPFNSARWIGPVIAPTVVVIHDTASRLEPGNAARYLQDNDAKVSVHFVLERDGKVVQQVPTNRRANHAGKSTFHGTDNVNGFSIGIELVNVGRMTGSPDAAHAVTWFKERFDTGQPDIEYVSTPEHGTAWWQDYTPEQIAALIDLLSGLFGYVKSLKYITTHWYISPGRKTDTNPLFPLASVCARVLGREDVASDEADCASDAVPEIEHVAIDVPSSTLNMRREPYLHNPNVITAIPDGVLVPVLRQGAFAGREWLKVFYAGQEGWIVASHTAPVTFSTAA